MKNQAQQRRTAYAVFAKRPGESRGRKVDHFVLGGHNTNTVWNEPLRTMIDTIGLTASFPVGTLFKLAEVHPA